MKMGHAPGFTLIELLVVIAIIGSLLAISVSLFKRTGSESLRTSADRFMSMVEQGRTAAITRRKPVALVLINPSSQNPDRPAQLGLFELAEWESGKPAVGTQIQRYETISPGMAFLPDDEDGMMNVLEAPAIRLTWKNGQESADFPALVFSPRGGLLSPAGSEPVLVSVGGAVLRNGTLVVTKSGRRDIRVGRVVARPWLLDE
ncbi:MAG: prepilin-type N-terminal cleavage/methylation domain-containing protein [Akkermansiaceae bacterium]|jgi:prepilin-type N-terminal cleavage/methylation domain-containing protein|nr:prepilin-type N-terminal cleavage/methylation domain-containing protein [Akkermansiaceae bacterium]